MTHIFLAASSAQSSKKRYVVLVVDMEFKSQYLSKKKGKVASGSHMNEDFKRGATGGQEGRRAGGARVESGELLFTAEGGDRGR